jgi:hypothetical protein
MKGTDDMRAKPTNELGANAGAGRGFSGSWRRSCQKLVTHMQKARAAILSETWGAAAPAHMLELALNEAEAVAWQTGYPQLVFPTLAMEKAQAVADWSRHQHSIRQVARGLAVAA